MHYASTNQVVRRRNASLVIAARIEMFRVLRNGPVGIVKYSPLLSMHRQILLVMGMVLPPPMIPRVIILPRIGVVYLVSQMRLPFDEIAGLKWLVTWCRFHEELRIRRSLRIWMVTLSGTLLLPHLVRYKYMAVCLAVVRYQTMVWKMPTSWLFANTSKSCRQRKTISYCVVRGTRRFKRHVTENCCKEEEFKWVGIGD